MYDASVPGARVLPVASALHGPNVRGKFGRDEASIVERAYASWAWVSLLLLMAACVRSKPSERPGPRAPEFRPPTSTTAPVPVPEGPLYAADEALRDVLSGELQYLGTGRWPGVERSRACAFRNARVLIVNAYCTLTETQAFRLEVFSPQRGRVRIYAEANGPVSKRSRGDYFTFMAESGLPPSAESRMPPLALSMSYDELRIYEQRRYDAYLPSCFGGEQNQRAVGGCLGALAPRQGQWTARNSGFLQHPNDDWYRVVERMRTLARLFGRDPE